MARKSLTPPVRRTQCPPFWEMGEYPFEEMCAALLDAQPDIRVAERYGIRGQEQFGADIVGNLNDGGLIVGQCKCYQSFTPAKINTAAKAFLDNLVYWQNRDTRRFVLLVAAPMEEKGRQERALHWSAVFQGHGITFELWGQAVLANRLRSHPPIVSRYLDPGWVEKLCGQTNEDYAAPRGVKPDAVGLTVDRFVAADLGRASDLYYAGRSKSALSVIEALRGDSTAWTALPLSRQAEILRIEAQVRLSMSGSAEIAKALADQADSLVPPMSGPTLRALIAWQTDGPDCALARLEGEIAPPSRVLKSLILAKTGRFSQAEMELSALGLAADKEPEAFRVRALARLAEGKIEAALAYAQDALRLNSQSQVMRELHGCLLFYSAVAPSAVQPDLSHLPNPVDWLLVRRDDRSQQRLIEAEQIFAALLSDCELAPSDCTNYRLWRLACLCCHNGSLDDAQEEVRNILHEDRANPLAIAWALARNLDFAHDRSRIALENLREKGRAEIPHTLALVAMHLRSGRKDKAHRVLEADHPRFTEAGRDELWSRWWGQVTSNFEQTELLSGDVPINAFLDTCLSLASRNEFTFIADHADRLCQEVGTADAVTLAAEACLNTGRLAQYEAIMAQWAGCFPSGSIPLELRRAKIAAQFQRGKVPDALAEAEMLAAQSQSLADSVGLADLRLRVGDLLGVARALRPMPGRAPLPPTEVIRFSSALAQEYPDVARELLKSVDPAAIAKEHLALAYLTANRLGLSPETLPVMHAFQRAMSSGGLPGVELVNDISQVMERLNAGQAAANHALELYNTSRVPVHLLADERNIPLTALYTDRMEANQHRNGWPSGSLVFLRHGGRGLITDFPDSPSHWRLHVDVTSLLLAWQIGLLTKVEKCFTPLYVAPHLQSALLSMADSVGPQQPHLQAAMRRVLCLADNKQIAILPHDEGLNLVETARRMGGSLLDWGSATEDDDVRITCRNLIEAALSPEEANHARSHLGVEWDARGVGQEFHGQAIILRMDMATQLAEAGVLDRLASAVSMFVDGAELERLRAELKDGERHESRARWIGDLRDHVARQLQSGFYQIASVRPVERPNGDPIGLDLAALVDLIQLESQTGNAVWCDDRLVNGHHTAAGTAPVLSIQDLLDALWKYGFLDAPERWSMLHRLRAGNAAFLLPTKEEILHWLLRAPVRDGLVEETPELAVLRRNIASAAGGPLLGPNQPEDACNPDGEVYFAIRSQSAIKEALADCFRDENQPFDTVMARADWIWSMLWTERPLQLSVWGRTTAEIDNATSLAFASLFAAAFLLDHKAGPDSPRGRFLLWLQARVVEQRLMVAPSLLHATVTALASILASGLDETVDGSMLQVLRSLLLTFLSDLSSVIAGALRKTPEIRRHVEAISRSVISLGSHHFDPSGFFTAVVAATDRQPVCLTSDEETEFLVTRKDHGDRFNLVFHNDAATITLTGTANAAFLPTAEERRAYIEANEQAFDLPRARLSAMAEQIARESHPGHRADMINAALQDNCAHLYRGLQDAMKRESGEIFDVTKLVPPTLDAMLRYLRLDPTDSSEVMLDRAAARLLEDVDLGEALWRFASLPAPLPECLMDAARALPKMRIWRLAVAWRKRPNTQLAMLQFAKLLTDVLGPSPAVSEHISSFLTDPERSNIHTGLMGAIGWAFQLFAQLPEYRNLPLHIRLTMAWCHGDKIYAAFLSEGRGIALNGRFTLRLIYEFVRNGHDVALPRHLSEEFFLLQGLAYALGDHGPTVLGQEGSNQLRTLLTTGISGFPLRPSLHRDVQAAPNALGSFFGWPVENSLSKLGFTDEAAAVILLRDHVLDDLAQEQEDVRPWSWLVGLYPHGRLPEPAVSRARDALMSTDLVALHQSEPAATTSVVIYLAEMAKIFSGPTGTEYIRNQVLLLARNLAGKGDETPISLLYALVILSSQMDDLPTCLNRLSDDLRTLVGILPAIATRSRNLVTYVLGEFSPSDANPLLEVLVELRSYE